MATTEDPALATATLAPVRYVAIGDSFTEGVGDELPDGHVRGWADLVALGWARALNTPIEYANLAIRGRLAGPIVEEQLDAALALNPTHLSFNGGGNDMLRPRASLDHIIGRVHHVVERCAAAGVQLILLSGGNPCAGLPLGSSIERRGDLLATTIDDELGSHPDLLLVQNWFDRELATAPFWSPDRLHLNARGHHRVAARVLAQIGVTAPSEWWHLDPDHVQSGPRGVAYYREHVLPWLHRRITRTSSGDGRAAKFGGGWVRIAPDMPDALDGSGEQDAPAAPDAAATLR